MSNSIDEKAGSMICPRCTSFIPNDESPGAYRDAISRTGNKTEMCSACGTREVMEVFASGQVIPQNLWTCNRDTSSDWKGPNHEIDELINTHPNRDALIAFLNESSLCGTPEDFDFFEESFLGTWSSVEEYAENFVENIGLLHDVPPMLRPYLDYSRFAHDLQITDIYTLESPDGELWVFLH
jgi:hypothetical protein